jgi:NADH dehydrogenase
MIGDPANGRWPLVTIFGGSGFIGRHLVRTLAKRPVRIRVACRRPDLAGHLQPLGRVGQIQVVQANLRYAESVAAAAQGADAVVNLVGLLRHGGAQTFDALHVEGAATVARAAVRCGARGLVHLSAIGADSSSPSRYGRSKAAGEAAVREALPATVILRPSVVFGPEDNFLNRFAAMARISPVLPLFGDGGVRFQPVFVGDVAGAIMAALEGRASAAATYELGGPRVESLREIMAFICRTTGRRRLFLPLPWPAAGGMAAVNEFVAGFGVLPEWAVLTRDQLGLMRNDNIVSAAATAEGRTLQGLGIDPDSMEAIGPTYLWRFRKTGQYEHDRAA